MKPEYVVYVLTFLAAVVVALTRIRLMKDSVAGRPIVAWQIGRAHV